MNSRMNNVKTQIKEIYSDTSSEPSKVYKENGKITYSKKIS